MENPITVIAQSSGASDDHQIEAGTTLPAFLADVLKLTDLNFSRSTILVNNTKVASNEVAARLFLNDGDEVYLGKTHTNG